MFDRIKHQALDAMRQAGMTDDQVQKASGELDRRMVEQGDPKIALIGFTGVGKSSTINALFNAGQAIGHVRACTQEAHEVQGDVTEYTGRKGSIIVYDMPGLGEDIRADERHLATYASVLPKVDVAVWIFHAGDRAMTPMQQALQKLTQLIGSEFSSRLLFATNKADAIAPGELAWMTKFNLPSKEQKANLDEFETYVLEKVHQVLPQWRGSIVTYSSRHRYRLEQLMTAMVESADSSRRWTLEQRADVGNYLEEMDPQVLAYLKDHGDDLGPEGSRPWRQG